MYTNNQPELVSVVIPTYERIDSLEHAVKSALAQTFANFEILVVNDSDSELPVKQLILSINDNRIGYLKNNRKKGANGARNTGIKNAKGEFVAFLDDDDEWLPEKLERQIDIMQTKSKEYGGVIGAYCFKNKKRGVRADKGHIFNLRDVILGMAPIGSGSNLLFRKDVFNNIGLWDEDLHRQQDLEIMVRFINKYKLAYDNKVSIIVNGHNPPNAKKAFEEREKYVTKVLPFINLLAIKDQKKFFAIHYRRQALYLLFMRERKKAVEYWKSALKSNLILFKKDLKLLYYYFKSFIF